MNKIVNQINQIYFDNIFDNIRDDAQPIFCTSEFLIYLAENIERHEQSNKTRKTKNVQQ